ncbi:hypothetical protein ACHAWF_011585 [Thalassiosira exigua]
MSSRLDEYLWIAIVGGIFGFIYCFGIGANDVANAFATSVASKSITLKQAVIIASLFEFCGVLFLGASVASTVRGKIFNIDDYEDEPEIVMLGMLISLVSASFMLLTATYFGLPVSANQTVIGCIIGFSLSAKGFASVNWNETKNIFISWAAAPLLTGTIGFCIFLFIRHCILLSEDPFHRGYYTFPIILFASIGINLFFIFSKGTKNFTDFHEVVPTSFGVGALIGLSWIWPVGPLMKKRMEAKRNAIQSTPAQTLTRDAVAGISAVHARLVQQPQSIPSTQLSPLLKTSASFCSIASIGSSIGSHKERKGSAIAEYDEEEGAIKFAVAESVKSLKLTIDPWEVTDTSDKEDITEHATNIDESQKKVMKRKKKNFLIRFEAERWEKGSGKRRTSWCGGVLEGILHVGEKMSTKFQCVPICESEVSLISTGECKKTCDKSDTDHLCGRDARLHVHALLFTQVTSHQENILRSTNRSRLKDPCLPFSRAEYLRESEVPTLHERESSEAMPEAVATKSGDGSEMNRANVLPDQAAAMPFCQPKRKSPPESLENAASRPRRVTVAAKPSNI